MKIEKCYEKSINMTLNLKQNTQKTQKEKKAVFQKTGKKMQANINLY